MSDTVDTCLLILAWGYRCGLLLLGNIYGVVNSDDLSNDVGVVIVVDNYIVGMDSCLTCTRLLEDNPLRLPSLSLSAMKPCPDK